jgi:hypothetical protein
VSFTWRLGAEIARGAKPAWLRPSPTLWLLAAITMLALAVQIRYGVKTDVSWNITLAEKVLDGQRPNIDFFEINPPLSYLLYAPPALAARLTGTSPEFMVDLFCFLCAAVSLGLAGLTLIRSGVVTREAIARFAIVGAATLLLLPAQTFGQREHIAVMASLPCLAALATWAARRRFDLWLSVVAGFGAGVAMAIKPPFALFFLLNLFFLAVRAGWRALFLRVELYVALAVVVFYWIGVALWCPAFFDFTAPIVRDIYLPVRRPLIAFLCDPNLAVWLAVCVVFIFAFGKRLNEPLIATPALASLGAMGAYLIQGKLWVYQGYPALAFAALALGPPVLESLAGMREAIDASMRMIVAAASVAFLTLGGFWFEANADKRELERAVAAIAPHPKLLTIGADISIGHPLTRRIQGVWVGSTFGLWITDMSSLALEHDPPLEEARRYQDYLRFDRETLVADIVNKKPDAILIASNAWLGWANRHADVAAALADYQLRETADDVMVYARTSQEGR